jgi:hypothetical protein
MDNVPQSIPATDSVASGPATVPQTSDSAHAAAVVAVAAAAAAAAATAGSAAAAAAGVGAARGETQFDPNKLTVEELRDELRARSLNTVGLKSALVERLAASISGPGGIPYLMVRVLAVAHLPPDDLRTRALRCMHRHSYIHAHESRPLSTHPARK